MHYDQDQLDGTFDDPRVPERLRLTAPTSFEAAARFWRVAIGDEHLSPRMKELVLLALHASATALNEKAIRRHVERARVAGASEHDVIDVLLSIVGLSNHALYFAVPILLEELRATRGPDAAELPSTRSDIEEIREDFVKTRGFWNEQRDTIARLLPDYFKALSGLSTEPWKHGSLTPKERELIYIAIDSSVTHMYGTGLALHIRHALQHGATREEILTIFQLGALTGLETFILGSEALFGRN
ncbi:alkylhydroperoxidase/carboxymuconolactone decarboxylase family protein YurZ [Paraburkholderia sp. WC7.3g]|uniref:Carboxymuconolactone decarboxylase family protein n=1 Tax=Paraburkholderia podalyriae TaxID=1938811 RepID=A0ABR7PHV6_9BURK|nr:MULTISPECIES: carboxymuconolactone decarboxylase family protein [Paraburkholderia]MBB5406346.1 alkylhydroperoxidase/carboxymuconolactone decarboxylase family protein YurZ [Paraburkholderia sp. HC6.4b]MBB5448744.1 alkylhydroperoxidase/carboxymuconolactone decarboxylase family protein YurZ [Paraburkholderia sp. Kb1A]MBC8745951.1 carboxymuconolactone decarboxylase family protein [Paraburkholderia podalyriae]